VLGDGQLGLGTDKLTVAGSVDKMVCVMVLVQIFTESSREEFLYSATCLREFWTRQIVE
jgi:hypothetical protein